jgi:predicted nucleic acid-binding protein
MRFWDASAIVPLVVPEAATDAAAQMIADDHDIAIWWATPVECASALVRGVRAGRIDEAALDAALARLDALTGYACIVEPCDNIRADARRLLRTHVLRAHDALQLAAAMELRDAPSLRHQFVTFDDRLALAARREGFTTN